VTGLLTGLQNVTRSDGVRWRSYGVNDGEVECTLGLTVEYALVHTPIPSRLSHSHISPYLISSYPYLIPSYPYRLILSISFHLIHISRLSHSFCRITNPSLLDSSRRCLGPLAILSNGVGDGMEWCWTGCPLTVRVGLGYPRVTCGIPYTPYPNWERHWGTVISLQELFWNEFIPRAAQSCEVWSSRSSVEANSQNKISLCVGSVAPAKKSGRHKKDKENKRDGEERRHVYLDVFVLIPNR
jgi:hypothetical protein